MATDHGQFINAVNGVNDALDFERSDILTTDLQHVLDTICEANRAVGEQRHLIAGVHEAIGPKRSGCGLLVSKIFLEQRDAPDAADMQRAGLATPHLVAIRTQDADVVLRRRPPDRAERNRHVGKADQAMGKSSVMPHQLSGRMPNFSITIGSEKATPQFRKACVFGISTLSSAR